MKVVAHSRYLLEKLMVSTCCSEYDFGDHGPLENDDWNLQEFTLMCRLKENYGYRYYTNWQLNKNDEEQHTEH